MAIETVELKCPNCGAPISLDTKECAYCSSPIVIRTVNNFFSFADEQNSPFFEKTACPDLSVVTAFLNAKLYTEALNCCDSVIKNNFNNADAHFYAAIASLKGKRPFVVSATVIKKAEEHLQTAIAIEPKGIYYYFWAYIRLDHHFKKFYKASPDYQELFSNAKNAGLSPTDANELYGILDVERPSEL